MPRPLIALLIALAGCSTVRARGSWAGDTTVGTLIVAAGIAVAVAEASDVPSGPWCDADVADPPHTCPAQAQEPR